MPTTGDTDGTTTTSTTTTSTDCTDQNNCGGYVDDENDIADTVVATCPDTSHRVYHGGYHHHHPRNHTLPSPHPSYYYDDGSGYHAHGYGHHNHHHPLVHATHAHHHPTPGMTDLRADLVAPITGAWICDTYVSSTPIVDTIDGVEMFTIDRTFTGSDGNTSTLTQYFKPLEYPWRPRYQVAMKWFDGIKSNGSSGWGFTVQAMASGYQRYKFTDKLEQFYDPTDLYPDLCLVVAPRRAHLPRQIRVVGNSHACGLTVTVTGWSHLNGYGAGEVESVASCVGKDIYVGNLHPPYVIKIHEIKPSAGIDGVQIMEMACVAA
jgi:hypothetical protein